MEEKNMEQMNQSTDAATVEEQAGQQAKYTDADVDRIIAKKIAAERRRVSKMFDAELEERERNIATRELKADARDMLADKGLPAALLSSLNYTSREALEKSMEDVGQAFNDAVQEAIKTRLRNEFRPIKKGYGSAGSDAAFREAFKPRV